MNINEHMGDFFWSAREKALAREMFFYDVSFSKPSPRSKSEENGVPRIGLRIGGGLF